MHHSQISHLRLAGRAVDYQKLGIAPVEVAQFEDGQRIGTENSTDAVRHACQGQLKIATGVVERVPRGLQRDMADEVAI